MLDAALAGEEVSVADENVMSLEYFDDLGPICALVLSVGKAEDLDDVPNLVRQAFDVHVRERQSVHERREEFVAAGGDWRAGTRSRPYTGLPESAALLAAVAPVAVEVLVAGIPEALAARIAPFVERVRRGVERSQTPRQFAYFGSSPRLEAAFERCCRPYRKVSSRVGMDAKRFGTGDVPDLSLGAHHRPRAAAVLGGTLRGVPRGVPSRGPARPRPPGVFDVAGEADLRCDLGGGGPTARAPGRSRPKHGEQGREPPELLRRRRGISPEDPRDRLAGRQGPDARGSRVEAPSPLKPH